MASQLAFFGWLVFLVSYIPVEVCLFIFARCSVFYYYYPAACGVGLMVERIDACRTKTECGAVAPKLAVNQRQIIRFDWSHFYVCSF